MYLISHHLHPRGPTATGSSYLCGDSTLHHTDVEVRRSSFVHLHTAVGNHKHGTIWEFHISGTKRLELYQLCLQTKKIYDFDQQITLI